jgi:hypothetical protein
VKFDRGYDSAVGVPSSLFLTAPSINRVQIIKGWLDESGKTQERVNDVAVSDGRKIGRDGHTPAWDERRQIIYIFLSSR